MSLVDDSLVTQKGVMWMLAYLLASCLFLGYCLVTFWPSPSPLVISAIEPIKGNTPGRVIVSGSGFTVGMMVSFDDAAGTIDKVENTSLTVGLPKHGLGQSDVIVKDLNGQAVAIPGGFTFAPTTASSTNVTGSSANINTGSGTGSTAGNEQSNKPARGSEDWRGADRQGAAEIKVDSNAPPGEYRSIEASNLSRVSFLFIFHLWLSQNIRILVIVMVVGALGSLIHVFRSFYWYVGNRTLKNSWLLMYILLPFSGGGLAVLFYLIIRGGISAQAPTNPSSLDGYAAIAALVGMFSQEALQKLKQLAAAIFTNAESGKDPAIPALKISGIAPSVGPIAGGTQVTISGTGFAAGNQVTFGGVVATVVAAVSTTQLTATTPPHAAGVVDIEVSNGPGQRSSLLKSFTYQ